MALGASEEHRKNNGLHTERQVLAYSLMRMAMALVGGWEEKKIMVYTHTGKTKHTHS